MRRTKHSRGRGSPDQGGGGVGACPAGSPVLLMGEGQEGSAPLLPLRSRQVAPPSPSPSSLIAYITILLIVIVIAITILLRCICGGGLLATTILLIVIAIIFLFDELCHNMCFARFSGY